MRLTGERMPELRGRGLPASMLSKKPEDRSIW
jgi:hypothetical protein